MTTDLTSEQNLLTTLAGALETYKSTIDDYDVDLQSPNLEADTVESIKAHKLEAEAGYNNTITEIQAIQKEVADKLNVPPGDVWDTVLKIVGDIETVAKTLPDVVGKPIVVICEGVIKAIEFIKSLNL